MRNIQIHSDLKALILCRQSAVYMNFNMQEQCFGSIRVLNRISMLRMLYFTRNVQIGYAKSPPEGCIYNCIYNLLRLTKQEKSN